MNAYLLFAKEVKMALLKENPAATQEDVDKLVHHKWRHVLTSEQKRPYFDRAEKIRRDAANKQHRKRERARLAATTAAAGLSPPPTGTPAEQSGLSKETRLGLVEEAEPEEATKTEPSVSLDTDAGVSVEGNPVVIDPPPGPDSDAGSAPSSPDSGCPSTPEGSDAASISPVPCRQSKATGKTFNNKVPFVHRISNRQDAYPGISHGAASFPIGPAGQPIPYAMVPHMIPHPAFPHPFMHPYFFPPTSMMQMQMHSYLTGYGVGQMGPANMPVHANCMVNQMVPPNPYYGMPIYAPRQQAQQMVYPQNGAVTTTCSAAAAKCCTAVMPPSASSSILEEFSGDARCFPDMTINDDDSKSDYSLNDVSYEPVGWRVACE